MVYALEKAKKQAKQLAVKALAVSEQLIEVQLPPAGIEADLAIPLFKVAKEKKQNPAELAAVAAKKIKLEGSLFSKVKAVGPYLNFYLDWKSFNPLVFSDYKQLKEKYGSSDLGKGKTIVIDYSAPNIAKPFSVGHLRSTIIGQALYNIYSFLGYGVIGDNHVGDWGTQFGKLMCAYKKWGSKEEVKKDPIKKLLELYVKFHDETERSPELKAKLEAEARAWFKKLEQGDKEATQLWKWFRELSLEEFNRIYKLLNVKFDVILGESFYNDKLKAVVKEALDKGIAQWAKAKQRTEEAVVEEEVEKEERVALVWLKKYGIGAPLLLQKSDGTSLYATRDLATAKYRLEQWRPVKILYVVGSEQKLYFKQVFKTLGLLGYKDSFVHVPFGLIRLPEGRMATRKGRVIFLEDVLKESVKRAKAIIMERELSEKEKEQIAKAVGIGAVKYADLSQDRIKDIEFSWDKALNLKGNSAPYIQYVYVRARSIARKAKQQAKKGTKIEPQALQEQQEIALIKKVALFPEVVIQAAESYHPHLIASYLFSLAQAFSKFYESVPVLKAQPDLRLSRLKLVEITSNIIKKGLALLGIECPERM